MEQHRKGAGPEIPKRAGIARHALLDRGFTAAGMTRRADTNAPLANPERQAICSAKSVVMAGAAGDIAIAGQNFVIEEQLSDLGAGRRKAMIIGVGQRLRIG